MSGTDRTVPVVRVVAFYGPHLRSAREFLCRLETDPRVDLVAAFCHARSDGMADHLRNLLRRRGALGPLIFVAERLSGATDALLHPFGRRRLRACWRRVRRKVRFAPRMHAPDVIEAVRLLAPDVGVAYGGPILRPELFRVPALGTLGIHHGRMPEYRGKKTTFWEIAEGETHAGVTIQRIDEGIDTGEIVARGEVPIGRKRYGRVWREVQALGIDLFADAVVALASGTADPRRPTKSPGPLRRDPTAADLLRMWWRRARGTGMPAGDGGQSGDER